MLQKMGGRLFLLGGLVVLFGRHRGPDRLAKKVLQCKYC